MVHPRPGVDVAYSHLLYGIKYGGLGNLEDVQVHSNNCFSNNCFSKSDKDTKTSVLASHCNLLFFLQLSRQPTASADSI